MTFDTWKTMDPLDYALGPSRKTIAEKIEVLESEIDWLTNRLGHLVLSEEDHEQSVDLIIELKEELASLKGYFENHVTR